MIEAIEGEMKDLIAEKLRRLRNMGGVTLEDLSEKSGICISRLSQLERGRNRFAGQVYIRYIRALEALCSQKKEQMETLISNMEKILKVDEETKEN